MTIFNRIRFNHGKSSVCCHFYVIIILDFKNTALFVIYITKQTKNRLFINRIKRVLFQNVVLKVVVFQLRPESNLLHFPNRIQRN